MAMTDLGGTSDAVAFAGEWDGPVVATSVHAGHELRPEIAAAMVLEESERFREEDPWTDRIASVVPDRVITARSRFEADLNRPRREAVYRTPDDCWGLEVWRGGTLSDELFEGSLATYDAFYDALAPRLDALAERGPFVLLDVHSYNHRRHGADAEPEPAEDNPVVNVGTGTLDHERFGPLLGDFMETLSKQQVGGEPLDVRENVKFQGRAVSWWVHERYAGVGCCLALEFKKTFMDEWTAEVDHQRLAETVRALGATVPVLDQALARLR